VEQDLAELLDTFRCISIGFWLVLPLDAEEVEWNAADNDEDVDAQVDGLVVGWDENEGEADDEEHDWNENVDFDGPWPVGSKRK
jgi:hypothetical protein